MGNTESHDPLWPSPLGSSTASASSFSNSSHYSNRIGGFIANLINGGPDDDQNQQPQELNTFEKRRTPSHYGSFTGTVDPTPKLDFRPNYFIEHVIDQKRDTVASISIAYGITQQQLKRANNLIDEEIFYHKVLCVPITKDNAKQVQQAHGILNSLDDDDSSSSSTTSNDNDKDNKRNINTTNNNSNNNSGSDEEVVEDSEEIVSSSGNESPKSSSNQQQQQQQRKTRRKRRSSSPRSNKEELVLQVRNSPYEDALYEDEFVCCVDDGIILFNFYWPSGQERKILYKAIEDVKSIRHTALRGDLAIAGTLFESSFCHHRQHFKTVLVIEEHKRRIPCAFSCRNVDKVLSILNSKAREAADFPSVLASSPSPSPSPATCGNRSMKQQQRY